MKKNLLLLPLLLILCFLTTGCVKNSYVMELDVEDNITVSEIHGVNLTALANYGGKDILLKLEEKIASKEVEFKQKGYNFERYDEDNFKGYKITKTYPINEFRVENMPEGFSTSSEKPILCTEGFFKNTCTVDMLYSYNQVLSDEAIRYNVRVPNPDEKVIFKRGRMIRVVSETEDFDSATGRVTKKIQYSDGTTETTTYDKNVMEKLGESVDNMLSSTPDTQPVADLIIRVPGKATSKNATTPMSNYEFQWNLADKNRSVEIKLAYEKINWINIIILAGVVVVIMKIFMK